MFGINVCSPPGQLLLHVENIGRSCEGSQLVLVGSSSSSPFAPISGGPACVGSAWELVGQ